MSYEVERILDSKLKKSRVFYLVKWAGYSEDDATWEPASNLKNCKKLIEEYENQKNEKSNQENDNEEEDTTEQLKLSPEESENENQKEEEVEETSKNSSQKRKPAKKSKSPGTEILSAYKNKDGEVFYKVRLQTGELKDISESEARTRYTKHLIKFFEESYELK